MHPARLLIQTVSFGFIVLAVLNPAAAQYAGKGEHVTVVRANGFEIPGRAMSMSDRRIQFRSSRGGVMSFHGSELREVRTQTDTFTWDGKQNRFASAKVAAAKAGPAKLRGTWCGFLRYLPAGAVTSGFDHLSKYQHALCMMYVDKVNGSSASGTLVIPGHKYKTSVTLVCKPLADNRREKDVQKYFSVEGSVGATVPLSAGVTRFPLGVACTTHDGLLPNGLTLDLKSVPPEDTHSKKSAFTALVLTRQEDIQTGTAAINLPLTLDSPRLKFVQGTYSRTTSGLYDTGKITGLRPQLLGSGYDVIREKEWKPIKEDQWMPHVRFFATINNPTAQAYDVKLACLFHVDNEAMITGNVPHRGVFTVRIPAKKTVTFGDGQKLRNLQATALRQSGLLGILLLASEVLVPQSDEHWHVPHVTNVSAAIISAMPVVEKK